MSASPTQKEPQQPPMFSSDAVPSTRHAGVAHLAQPRNLVYVNCYDITFANDFLLPLLGIGVFHSGIEVYGTEFAFGRAARGAGIFSIEPHAYPGHVYRESICLGATRLSEGEVWGLHLRNDKIWKGDAYRILDGTNCNDYSYHFGLMLVAAPDAATANRWMGEMERRFFAGSPTQQHPFAGPNSNSLAAVVHVPLAAQGPPLPCEMTYGGRLPLLAALGCCVGNQALQEYDDIFPAWLNRITRVANAILPRSWVVAIENADRSHAGMPKLE
jgi:hypothetical protein